MKRRAVHVLLLLLTAVLLALGLHDLRHGLPFVFHSDYFQIGQAAQLLRHGWFTDDNLYPLPLVWLYAGVAEAVHALAVLAGSDESRAAFAERFADPVVHHALGRGVGVACAALLVPATWRLARVRFPRDVALLAAAAVAVDPVLLSTARQVRPHAPAVLLMVAVAPWVLRLARGTAAGPRDGLIAGALVGATAAVFQVAALQIVAALAIVGTCVRPARRAWTTAAAAVGGMLAGAALVTLLARTPAAVRSLPGSSAADAQHTAGLLPRLLDWASSGRFREAGAGWLAAEPLLLACAAGAVVLALRRQHRSAATDGDRLRDAGAVASARRLPGPLDLLLYAAFPVAVLACTGASLGAHVRYVLAAVPFFAVLAAATCRAPRRAALRVLLAVLLVGVPLSLSARALWLLRTVDTRLALDALVGALGEGTGDEAIGRAPPVVAVQDSLVLDRGALPAGVLEFPRHGDVSQWGAAPPSPREALVRSGAVAYARVPGAHWAAGPLNAASMEQLGFRLHGTLASAPLSRLYLPDVPDAIFPDVWRTRRTGPPIELWVRAGSAGDAVRRRLEDVAPADDFASWTGLPAGPGCTMAGAVEAALARARIRAAAGATAAAAPVPSAVSGLHVVRLDVDGDGTAEDVASALDATQLSRLLTLPADRWRDAGGALGPVRTTEPASAGGGAPAADAAAGRASSTEAVAPSLGARGTLLNGEPVLLLLRGARPAARLSVVVGGGELRAAFRGGVLVPSPDLVLGGLDTGPSGDLALAALWPRGTPAGATLVVQAWIEDPSGPRGFTASNAVTGTSPD